MLLCWYTYLKLQNKFMFCSDVVENVIANIDYRGDESSAKLGAQITYEILKSGCTKSIIYLLQTQKKVCICPALHIRLQHP